VWAPGSAIRIQCDSAVQLSPEVYRQAVLPHDRKIMQAFDFCLMDLHSAGNLRLHEILAGEPDLDAISVTLDRLSGAPGILELSQTFKNILESKSLLVYGDVTRDELDVLLKLPPRGLCLSVRVTG
jgi:hypothetical protein